MGRLRPLLIGMVGAGVLGVVIAVVVPLLVLTERDRGAGEPEPFPSATPVMEGIRQGQAALEIPTSTPGAVAAPSPTATPGPTATPSPTPIPGPDPTSTPTSVSQPAGDPAAGEQVFTTASPLTCSTCHSIDGTTGLGPSLQGIATRAETRVPGLSAGEYITQSILDPNAFVVDGFPPSLMPQNFSETLTTQDIADVVAFLLSQ
ncbi:MAG: c-type cytochrome [Chloroflexi bacterium]|nr:c-type cytochrome [Chloroflexota bacterium]